MTGMHIIIASFLTQSCYGMKEIEGTKHDKVNHFPNCVAMLCVQQRMVVVEKLVHLFVLKHKTKAEKEAIRFPRLRQLYSFTLSCAFQVHRCLSLVAITSDWDTP